MLIRIKQILVLIIYIIICVLLSGCWNNRDVTEMSITIAVGLDRTEDNKIELTVQLVKPSAMQRDNTGGKEKAYTVFSSTGDTVFEALRNQLSAVDRKIFISHLQLIVIGESVAWEGVQDVLDLFERDHELNLQADVIITKGITAKELLHAESEMECLPAMHMVDILKNHVAIGKIKKILLFDLMKEIGNQGCEPVIGVITPKNQDIKEVKYIKDLKIEGASVLKGDKLVGWLNSEETRGLLFAINDIKSTIINVPHPLEKTKKVAIEVTQSNAKMDVEIKDNQVTLIIEVNQEGNIGDQQEIGDLTTPEMIKKLEDETAEVIKKEIHDVLYLTQKIYETDIFGFGEITHRKYLNYWKQVKGRWNQEFSEASVKIKVKSSIRRVGMIIKPTKPQ